MPRGIDTPEQILLLLFSLVASIIFSWWTYRGNQGLTPGRMWLLTILRGSALFLLILLLFNPVIRKTNILVDKPAIGILLDNSRSVTVAKGDYEGESSYRQAQRGLAPDDTSEVSFRFYGFDNDVFRLPGREPDLDGTSTDINLALTGIVQSEPDLKAIILYSDGIFNRGRNPAATVSQLGIPVITVGLGDTTSMRDLVVRSINVNETGYKNTETPIIAEILNDGFPDTSFEIQLRKDGVVIDRQSITTASERSVHRVQFNTKLTETGLLRYEILIPELPGEFTPANNRASGTINVLDDQLRVLHIAFEIHPDISAFRNLLSTDENISPAMLNWYGGEKFSGGGITNRPDSVDLLILHGYPNRNLSAAIKNEVQSLINELPILLLTTPGSDNVTLTDDMGNRLPVITNRSAGNSGIQLFAVEANSDHPVMELPITDLTRTPLLRAPVTGIEPGIGVTELFRARLRNQETEAPVITLRTVGNRRISQVNAFELFRWFQSTNQEHREYMAALLSNLVKWTSNEPDNRLLTISPARPVFDENEQIRFEATLRNESGDFESDALIEITVTKPDAQPGTYTMTNRGLGRYELQIPTMPAGTYRYEALARKGNTRIDEQSGTVNVSETNLEYIDTRRNDELLAWIAGQTGGTFIPYDEADRLPAILRDLNVLEVVTTEFTTDTPLYQSPAWFILLIVLLTIEWIIRKQAALV
ncbi:MAG: vWA domain-containing protein [Cyclonatronaceae bacterium]